MLKANDTDKLTKAIESHALIYPAPLCLIDGDRLYPTDLYLDYFLPPSKTADDLSKDDIISAQNQPFLAPLYEDSSSGVELEISYLQNTADSVISYELIFIPLEGRKQLMVLMNGIHFLSGYSTNLNNFSRAEYFEDDIWVLATQDKRVQNYSINFKKSFGVEKENNEICVGDMRITKIEESDDPRVSYWQHQTHDKLFVHSANLVGHKTINGLYFVREAKNNLSTINVIRTLAKTVMKHHDPILFSDVNGYIYECNSSAADLLNSSKHLLLGQNIFDIFSFISSQDDDALSKDVVRQKLTEKHYYQTHITVDREFDSRLYEITVVEDQDSYFINSACYSWQLRDVTTKHRDLQTIRKNSFILNQIKEAVFVINYDDLITECNQAAVQLCRKLRGQIINTPVSKALGVKDESFIAGDIMKETVSQNDQWQGKVISRVEGDKTFYVDITLQRYLNPKGEPEGYICIARDITNKELQSQTYQRHAKIIDEISDAVIMTDQENYIIDTNPAARNQFALLKDFGDNNGSSGLIQIFDLLQDFGPDIKHKLDHSLVNKTSWSTEVLYKGNWIELSVEFIKSQENNEAQGAIYFFRDIQERIEQQEELNDREEALNMRILELEDVQKRLETQSRELVILADELAVARDDAQQADRAKSDFMAIMSHEIRTPVNGVVGMADLLLDSQLNNEQRHYCESLKESAVSLVSLINDILDFSKMEAGRLELESISFNLPKLVENVVELFAPTAHAKGINIVTCINPDTPEKLIGDPSRIRQVLQNLISNAVKFTHKGGVAIHLDYESLDDKSASIAVQVHDTGIGIHESVLPKLFKKFSQADSSMNRKFGGTGLGLSICKQLIQLMGGNIGVDSIEDKGSNFYFSFALDIENPKQTNTYFDISKKLQQAEIALINQEKIVSHAITKQIMMWGGDCMIFEDFQDLTRWSGTMGLNTKIILIDDHLISFGANQFAERLKSQEKTKDHKIIFLKDVRNNIQISDRHYDLLIRKPLTSSHLAQRLVDVLSSTTVENKIDQEKLDLPITKPDREVNILVVDDNPVNQLLAVKILERIGYHVDLAFNGLEAIEAAESGLYDLILMDVQMPIMDGMEATKQIRQSDNFKVRNVPIIALTANAMTGDREKYLQCGMTDYVSKPIDRDELYQKVNLQLNISSYKASSKDAEAPFEDVVENNHEDDQNYLGSRETSLSQKDILLTNLLDDLDRYIH